MLLQLSVTSSTQQNRKKNILSAIGYLSFLSFFGHQTPWSNSSALLSSRNIIWIFNYCLMMREDTSFQDFFPKISEVISSFTCFEEAYPLAWAGLMRNMNYSIHFIVLCPLCSSSWYHMWYILLKNCSVSRTAKVPERPTTLLRKPDHLPKNHLHTCQ